VQRLLLDNPLGSVKEEHEGKDVRKANGQRHLVEGMDGEHSLGHAG